jgi:signal transduction histidine kinase/ActR/RegA family two-component response regulator
MEEVARRTVKFFYENFIDGACGRRSCALVRMFKTHNYAELDEHLKDFAKTRFQDLEFADNMKAMVLLGTAGDEKSWNARQTSTNHQVIPLPSPDLVSRMPMISQLLSQFNLDVPSIVNPKTSLLEPEEQPYGLFYISEAVGNPFIPDQSTFVTTYGIKSVIGCGALLPSGNLFAIVVFSRQQIPQNTEELFRPLAMSMKSALVCFDGGRVFDSDPELMPTDTEATIMRLRSELAAVKELLNVSGQTVETQAGHLEETSKQLVTARDTALEASALKSAFVANISHELRTPLSGIVGMSELLAGTKLNEEQTGYSKGIEESARSLLTIVNDLLDFSKMEAGKLALEIVPFSVNELVQDVAKSFAENARVKQLSLSTNIDQLLPIHLLGDPSRIRQLLVNLVHNAIKFTDKGQVTIAVQATRTDAQIVSVRFSVQDTGIGLSDEELDKLFVPFLQMESARTRHAGGTGLGLSICKRIVELMDGEIGVSSRVDHGSEFWFSLPLREPLKDHDMADGTRMPVNRWESRLPNDLRLLVVEDNNLIRTLVMKQLSNLGLNPVGVLTGLEAVSAVCSEDFDLILMDCNLPDISGFEATRLIREYEHQTGRRTPIIAMTALAMAGDEMRCLKAGMDDYLSKPVIIEKLIARLEYWLARSARDADHADNK